MSDMVRGSEMGEGDAGGHDVDPGAAGMSVEGTQHLPCRGGQAAGRAPEAADYPPGQKHISQLPPHSMVHACIQEQECLSTSCFSVFVESPRLGAFLPPALSLVHCHTAILGEISGNSVFFGYYLRFIDVVFSSDYRVQESLS
jgi:hypothetical protein